ncbi:hypothetical protein ACG0Z6_05930 [Roseateles sp. BYS180W]|uniref:Uncharacterized protein n=1 Tax=Roseateles rivi TaxID=3299028 RepID=A0ABW7FU12_9BURK
MKPSLRFFTLAAAALAVLTVLLALLGRWVAPQVPTGLWLLYALGGLACLAVPVLVLMSLDMHFRQAVLRGGAADTHLLYQDLETDLMGLTEDRRPRSTKMRGTELPTDY